MEIQPESILIELIRYNNWANAQILATCRDLSPDQLVATAPGTYGTIHATLRHIIRAEADYVGRMTGDSPNPTFKWEDAPSLVEISAYAEQVGLAFLEAVQHVALTQIVHEEEDGKFIDYQASHLFIQAIDHGIEHRTNITTILSGLGLPTPEVDGWGYLFTHPDRFALKEGTL